jgi:hypothetical protein
MLYELRKKNSLLGLFNISYLYPKRKNYPENVASVLRSHTNLIIVITSGWVVIEARMIVIHITLVVQHVGLLLLYHSLCCLFDTVGYRDSVCLRTCLLIQHSKTIRCKVLSFKRLNLSDNYSEVTVIDSQND